MSMKIAIVLVAITLVLSGCLGTDKPKFDLDAPENLEFNPLHFEALKLWNEINQETKSYQLDACNVAKRIEGTTNAWEITLNRC